MKAANSKAKTLLLNVQRDAERLIAEAFGVASEDSAVFNELEALCRRGVGGELLNAVSLRAHRPLWAEQWGALAGVAGPSFTANRPDAARDLHRGALQRCLTYHERLNLARIWVRAGGSVWLAKHFSASPPKHGSLWHGGSQ